MIMASNLKTFETSIGWCGLVVRNQKLARIAIARKSAEDARKFLLSEDLEQDETQDDTTLLLEDAAAALQRYLSGENENLDHFPVDLSSLTPFQQQVLERVRAIPYGQYETYGSIAQACRRPKAARAVGGALARNPLPLIIPCHRVVGSSGRLTGFTAPRGVELKRQLLDMESH